MALELCFVTNNQLFYLIHALFLLISSDAEQETCIQHIRNAHAHGAYITHAKINMHCKVVTASELCDGYSIYTNK